MSLHAQLSPEATEKLRAQQRNSTISSVVISILMILLIGIVLLWILLPPIDNFTPEIVSYHAGSEDAEKVEKRQMNRVVERKPSSPSSSMARVIAAKTVSSIAIPVPEDVVPVESMDFGNGDGFGDGWGDGGGWGGGGGTTFFGQAVNGNRILYVIDYSLSMKGTRQRLMRDELSKSVTLLPPGKKYQIICFAGPVWVAGNGVKWSKSSATVSADKGHNYSWKSVNGAHDWKPSGKEQAPEWLSVTDSQIKESEKIIQTTPLVWGTNWANPLEMALRMDPLPNAIVFMTDGLSPGNPLAIAEEMSERAKKAGITINAVALMEPKAAEAMKILSKGTGGSFALIDANGNRINR